MLIRGRLRDAINQNSLESEQPTREASPAGGYYNGERGKKRRTRLHLLKRAPVGTALSIQRQSLPLSSRNHCADPDMDNDGREKDCAFPTKVRQPVRASLPSDILATPT